MKILIIDDNKDILQLLEFLLNSTGQEVVTIDNGKKGLDLILNNEYDLILLDLTMPEFSGFSVVEKLIESEKLKKNKILFFTAASVSDKELKKWYDFGIKGCIRKPVEPNDLFEKINEIGHTS